MPSCDKLRMIDVKARKIVKLPGPYQSVLNSHLVEIAQLRETRPQPTPYRTIAKILGAFKQTTQKFHRIFGKPLSIIGFCQFRPSQFSAHSKAGFLGDAASPMESTIRSSEKSNSPCKLKCCQVTAEPWRMASISSARRFSFFSAATSRER